MIKKIITIKNLGKLKNFSPPGDCEFNKSNLIFGENASGKTTIASIFRSIQDNNSKILIGRKSLGSSIPIEIEIRCESGNKKFINNKWDSVIPEIEIYDSKFISDNVFSGIYVDLINRRNLQIYAIGEESVILSKEIFNLDHQSREIQREKGELESQIKKKF